MGSDEEPGPVFSIAGIFDHDPLTRGWTIDADATLEDVPVGDLDTYWPQSIAANARDWVVENVTAGRVDKAAAALDVTVPEGDFDAAPVTGFSGTLDYRGVEVHSLRPLPPVGAAAGPAAFDPHALPFAVPSGRWPGFEIGRASCMGRGWQEVVLVV